VEIISASGLGNIEFHTMTWRDDDDDDDDNNYNYNNCNNYNNNK